jgi:hypothetical protein
VKTITILNNEDVQEKLAAFDDIETVDLGSVNLHLVVVNGRPQVVVENPFNDEMCALIELSA